MELIRLVFLSSLSVQNFIPIGQAIAEIFKFVSQKRLFFKTFFSETVHINSLYARVRKLWPSWPKHSQSMVYCGLKAAWRAVATHK